MNKTIHKILFVDDDPLIIRGLLRSMDQYSEFWHCEFVLSGEEALQMLETNSFDAVVTDLLMPKMNGLVLLEAIQKKFPETLRFVLSGNASDVNSVKAAIFVHQVFPKPCSMDLLFNRVEDACKMKDRLNDPNLIRLVTSIHSLPSMPKLFNKLMEELNSDEPNMQHVSEIVSNEPSMSAKTLQLVNSAFFGMAKSISDIHQAVRLLGLNTITALVYSSQIFSEFESSKYPLSIIRKLWNHSVYVSQFAKLFAIKLNLSKQHQENALISGLLHDIGKLLGMRIPDYYDFLFSSQEKITIEDEYRLFGTSHAELGAYLLGIWGLPLEIVENVLAHHNPDDLISAECNSMTVLHLANGLINMYTDGDETNFQNYVNINYLRKTIDENLLPDTLASFLHIVRAYFSDLENMDGDIENR